MKSVRLFLAAPVLVFWSSGAASASSIVYTNLGPGDTYSVGQGGTICNNPAVCFRSDLDLAAGFIPSGDYRLETISLPVGLVAGTMQLLMDDRPTERVLAAEAAAD